MIELLFGLAPAESNINFNLDIPVVAVQEEKKTPTYTVQQGDNLTKIAEKHNTSALRLWQKNTHLTNQDLISPGETITIPLPEEVLPDRPLYSIPQPQKSVRTPDIASQSVSSGSNTYTPGQCTWHTKNLLPWVPNGWGDATNWRQNALASGYTVSSVPRVGAVAWRSGHVAVVVGVGEGTVVISEMNYNWTPYATRTITIPATSYQYIY